jgi:uncharacterized protein
MYEMESRDMTDPNIVISGLSKRVTVEGEILSIEIYRLEEQNFWTLEVVDSTGTSTVWDDTFPSDQKALEVVEQTIEDEGISAFRDNANVIQFPG